MAVVAVAFALPSRASSTETEPIVVSGLASRETCSPCHPRLDTSDGERVNFDHASHLLVQCMACHRAPAHEGGGSAVPAMESCFACHGLQHGPVGMVASGDCSSCHPESFPLRPVTHVEDWRAKPHAEASAAGVNGCLLCHDAPLDCDACHVEQNVDVVAMPALYLNALPRLEARPAVVVDRAATPTASQCLYCHPDIDDFDVEGLVFTHNPHLERAYRCVSCHPVFPHGAAGIDRPEMRTCMRCHGLEHNGKGSVASAECAKCHTEGFELMPSDHTRPFLSGEHSTLATEDGAYCSQCHAPSACVECHNGGVELADGRLSEKVIPEGHLEPAWRSDHGGVYLAQKGMCVVCHTTEFCQQCHETTMPHPATWLAAHSKGNGTLPKDCAVCHSDRKTCQECHHAAVRSAELIPENCVRCHEEMDTDKPTEIEVAGLAEHAVHFAVAQPDKKGEPYTCDDCHIGFGSGGVQVTSPAMGPHDMRLCYECHGALDLRNTLIAPYSGAELCLRCHSDLNI